MVRSKNDSLILSRFNVCELRNFIKIPRRQQVKIDEHLPNILLT
jgi:hypothetical protein